VKKIGVLEYDLATISLQEFQYFKAVRKNPAFYMASLSLKMRIAPQLLRVQLCLGNQVIKTAKIPDPLLKDIVTLDL
jgi:hypothetical protein